MTFDTSYATFIRRFYLGLTITPSLLAQADHVIE
jgi:hypothetical protein